MNILKALFENGKMHYRRIVDLGIHPKIVRQELDEFIRRGLVKEEGRKDWKRGKKISYSLTPKGREEYIHSVINDLNLALKNVQEITTKLLSRPSQFERWRRMSKEAFYEIKITEKMPLNERIRAFLSETNRIYGPLQESYKNIHELICQLALPPGLRSTNMFVGLTEEGGLHFIPAELLRERGFGF